MDPSGIRLGTPAVTTRGMKEPEMKLIAEYIHKVLTHHTEPHALEVVKQKVRDLTSKFPLYT